MRTMSEIKKNNQGTVGSTFGERRQISDQRDRVQQAKQSVTQKPGITRQISDFFSGGRSRPTEVSDHRHKGDIVKVDQSPYSKYTQRANQKIQNGTNQGGKSPVTDEMRLRFLEAIMGKKV